ncbi:hypothetical protein NM688_g4726 [Phlebia brevispora]|uniref:Uncharacterized protein n=1 Tax=Phlebia brevispora TaxID=194682 RepID=A0ACC1T264_9APHY|nr:hypothetical protein NM688_g4726 [Phlebia brevispora]
MKHDYIPLTQSTSSETWHPEDLEDPTKTRAPPRRTRRVIFGSLLVTALFVFYLVVADWVEDSGDLDYDEDVPEWRAAYLPFEPPIQNASAGITRLTPTQELPDDCRDAYFSSGALCYDPEIPRMDVVWTWVNGSDPLLRAAKLHAESQFADDDPYRPKSSAAQERQYRDNDELKHSMRSALANFRHYTGRFHLITSDFAMPYNLSFPDNWRLGQVPQWLEVSGNSWVDGDVELSLIHHAEIFDSYNDTTFNSYGIESQFGHLSDVSDYFIYMNDDFYMSNPLTPRSFYTSVFGLVLRYDLGIMVGPEKPSPDEPHGEWRSMGESNVLLSARFGARHRPYVLHEAKGVSLSFLREITMMWPEPLRRAGSHPFRETVSGAGDVSMLFLLAHFVVERWREALLWSWAVAKHGSLSNGWDHGTASRPWSDLGGIPGQDELEVRAGYRDTLQDHRWKAYLQASGHRKSDKTQYRFTSWDGYPYAYMDEHHHDEWQSFLSDIPLDQMPVCTISHQECFMDGDPVLTTATDVFTNIAFRKPKCGDCVIQALVKASGSLGLEAFLPSPERVLPLAEENIAYDDDEVPHLPLAGRWEDAHFSLLSVMSESRELNVRAWTLRLLQRYRFMMAYTPYAFVMLEDVDNAKGALGWIDSYTDASMLCINDDVREGEEEVTEIFSSWQDRKWPKAAAWERT